MNIVPIRSRTRNLWPLIAAASVILLFGGLFVVYQFSKKPTQQQAAIKKYDIAPGSNKAILVLAGGQRISVTDATNGTIARQAGTTVSKSGNGQLIYQNTQNIAAVYNTLITPRGGQHYIRLADGTEVWLNAASSLRFPTAFNGKERVVELEGEADFKVVHNAKQPFFVKVKGQEIKDIGTEFDVNSYSDEPSVKTTLLEGIVEVKPEKGTVKRLQPGQQAVLSKNNFTIVSADLDEAIAWKNNQFVFNDEPLENILRQVSRWYNVEIVYEDESVRSIAFVGSLSRFSNISKLLHKLELTNQLTFEIEPGKVIVRKK